MTDTCSGTCVDGSDCQNEAGYGTDEDSDYCYLHETESGGNQFSTDFSEYASAEDAEGGS